MNITEGSIVVNNPLELVCLDLEKVYPSKDNKENALVIIDTFSYVKAATMTYKQNAQTVAPILTNKWFYTYGIAWYP